MIHNEQEYNEMLNEKARYEAEIAIRMDYENMLRQDAIEFLTKFYGSSPEIGGLEGENFITLIVSAFEFMDNKKLKSKLKQTHTP